MIFILYEILYFLNILKKGNLGYEKIISSMVLICSSLMTRGPTYKNFAGRGVFQSKANLQLF